VAKIERVTWVKDDEPKHYALTFYPLMGGAGGVVIRIDDITQRLSLEEMMVQSEKCCRSVALPPAWPTRSTTAGRDPA
jgi:hypothetical protein